MIKNRKIQLCPIRNDAGAYKPEGNGILDGIPKNIDKKKAHVINNISLHSGGTDGTRTRDPLRDRQVF